MNRAGIYYGLTKIAWAFVLLYIDISLGTLNLLPDWAGYLLIWQAISLLSGERRALELLRPFCLGLGLWSAAGWLLTLFSRSLSAGFLPLSVVVRVVSIYLSFQLLTDLAALAEQHQGEGWTLDRKLRFCRSVTAVLSVIPFLPLPWKDGVMLVPSLLLILCQAAVSILILYYLFSLRKFFRESDQAP